ncbi:hypothetical protein QQB70_003491 [Salmonella enterica]|uniref:hypothetical protein n=1 Tax=Salmonella enterica TaxID=28901 RepID=UPI000FAAD8D6|nr:hypothetical protein [Salmonella enterica]EBW6853423.1 hypothetical protein [Salmonella enterica subsp. enterica serovar Braenderup]EAW9076740.1 hypothetical protein [Salmonella enterica]ECC4354821.1 hypothetical protein [Salmonella enterica]ECW2124467.1 hypothetical protein [Salmonella enterica]
MEQKKGLPDKAYYTLSKAAKKINEVVGVSLDVADLIHYAAIEELEICVYISGDDNDFIEQRMMSNLANIDTPFAPYDSYHLFSEVDFDRIPVEDVYINGESKIAYRSCITDYVDIRQSYDLITRKEIDFSFAGIFTVSAPCFKEIEFDLLRTGQITLKTNLFHIPEGVVDEDSIYRPRWVQLPEVLTFGLPELVITDIEIERFISGEPSHKPLKKSESKNNLMPVSKKTFNAQSKFIKSLITAQFGQQVAANPRWHLDNEKGELYKLFKEARIKPATGKAVEGWIKNEEIDRF